MCVCLETACELGPVLCLFRKDVIMIRWGKEESIKATQGAALKIF